MLEIISSKEACVRLKLTRPTLMKYLKLGKIHKLDLPGNKFNWYSLCEELSKLKINSEKLEEK